ncbi:hypothetical protein BDQ17DRAFT_842534 [Cyathus striatus]|nr:hypothetical protein BDQ17DRAFT_842534 [Cyathus striatus]
MLATRLIFLKPIILILLVVGGECRIGHPLIISQINVGANTEHLKLRLPSQVITQYHQSADEVRRSCTLVVIARHATTYHER